MIATDQISVLTNISKKLMNKRACVTLTCLYILSLVPLTRLYGQRTFRVMSYNVENLFDCEDDPIKDDQSFLPDGILRWTKGRYYQKLQQIAKVITAAGEWHTPALVGLCEVENDSTIIHLLNKTPLRQQDYRYCMTNSPDNRGIDVALLYQRDQFAYIEHQSIRIKFRKHPDKRSRDILRVSGKILSGDTLDVLVCHFPSRSGGEKATEADRMDAARMLRNTCDSLLLNRKNPQFIIMGDFNDTPSDKSIIHGIKTMSYPSDTTSAHSLYNLFSNSEQLAKPGSHKYQGEWAQLDQIIVTGTLLDSRNPMHLIPGSNRLFTPQFLFKTDKTYHGTRPFRTYYGYKYEGGYSDHLPLLVDFSLPLAP